MTSDRETTEVLLRALREFRVAIFAIKGRYGTSPEIVRTFREKGGVAMAALEAHTDRPEWERLKTLLENVATLAEAVSRESIYNTVQPFVSRLESLESEIVALIEGKPRGLWGH
jgi:hypothetical protein